MKCKFKGWSNLLVLASFVLVLAGCGTAKKMPPKKNAVTHRVEKQVETQAQAVPSTSYAWLGYPQPCPTPEDAQVLVEKIVPKKVKPNSSFSYKITISNKAKYTINRINITEALPDGYKFLSSMPSPESAKGELVWSIKSIAPGQTKVITVTGKALKTGTLRYTGKTKLNFDLGQAQSVVDVVEPFLEFKIEAPKRVVISDMIPVKLSFRNSGKAKLDGCRLVHTLPKALLTSEGKSKIEMNIGDLEAGAVKSFDLQLKAKRTGIHTTAFIAMASEGISANAMMKVEVTKPNLIITSKAPTKRFVGNITPYQISVKNTGDAVATDVQVKLALDEGMKVVSATEGGKARDGAVYWAIKSIHPGETKRLSARALAKRIMIARAVAEASATAADKVESVMSTDVRGVAALVTGLVDINDPVPIGENEIYEITAENTGSLPATRIKIKCFLEDSMEYVQATGATKGILKGKVLTFESLPSLEPQAEAKWRVVIKAKKAGDVRFAITVESDQLQRPVEIDEATHFYE